MLLTTILGNIILQDVIYDVNVGALKAAIVYQSCLIVIFWLNKEKIIHAIQALSSGFLPL